MNKQLFSFWLVCIIPLALWAESLNSVFQNSGAAAGYDKLVELKAGQVYTGGITAQGGNILIKGNGAVIDLQGERLTFRGLTRVTLTGCIVINGSDGMLCQDSVTALVIQSVFYNNHFGIRYESPYGQIEVYNTILAKNSQYGFACNDGNAAILHYIDAYQNGLGNYAKFCYD